MGYASGRRSFLAAPLRQQGEFIGSLHARRTEVRPFTPAQIKLIETFADQAVIAIENVRLFNELKESLEQQTATSEILGVIASSPTDIQPVLDVVAETPRELCECNDAPIRLIEGDGTEIGGALWIVAGAGIHRPMISGNSRHRRAMIECRAFTLTICASPTTNFRAVRHYRATRRSRTYLSRPASA